MSRVIEPRIMPKYRHRVDVLTEHKTFPQYAMTHVYTFNGDIWVRTGFSMPRQETWKWRFCTRILHLLHHFCSRKQIQ